MIAIRTVPPTANRDGAILCRRSRLKSAGRGAAVEGRTPLARAGPQARAASVLAALRVNSPYWARSALVGANPPRRTVGRAARGPSKSLTRALETCPEFRLYPARSCSIRRDRACARPRRQGRDGYPPYNIERIARQNGQPERLRPARVAAHARCTARDGRGEPSS